MNRDINQRRFVLSIVLIFSSALAAFGADGDLDATFNGNGLIITDNNGSTADSVSDAAIQPDGKIVAAGSSFVSGNFITIVTRYNSDGSLDDTFGTGGKTIIQNSAFVNSAAVAPDGKIVLVGWQVIIPSPEFPSRDIFVARLNSDGTLDTTFNGSGTLFINFQNQSDDLGYSVKVQTDGKIVIGGLTGGATQYDFAVVRLNQNGSLDNSFDGDGKATTQLTPQRTGVFYGRIVLQPDGKIVATGSTRVSIGQNPTLIYQSLVTVRCNTDGSLDNTFDGDGIAFTRQSADDTFGNSVSILPDGKILVAGRGRAATQNFRAYLVRYNSDGSLDATFGTGGAVLTSFGPVIEAEVQADGKIIANFGDGIGRLFSNGALDTSFGTGGFSLIGFPGGTTYALNALTLQPNGKIVVGGYVQTNNARDFLLARFNNSVCINQCRDVPNKVADFDGDGKTDLSVFRSGNWYLNSSALNNPASYYGVNNYGSANDKPATADFDGDRKTDVAFFRDGVWNWISTTSGTFNSFQFGLAGDIPVPADYTGDGRAEIAVFRSGVWHIYNLADNQYTAIQFGLANDKPVLGDFDGDDKNDLAVYREGVWYIQRSPAGFYAVQFGIASDKPVVGDYDGDYKSDIAVFRDGVWYIWGSMQGVIIAQFGVAGDIPVAGDYDGDDKTDLAIFRNGVWWLNRTQLGVGIFQFGLASDKPLPAAFVP